MLRGRLLVVHTHIPCWPYNPGDTLVVLGEKVRDVWAVERVHDRKRDHADYAPGTLHRWLSIETCCTVGQPAPEVLTVALRTGLRERIAYATTRKPKSETNDERRAREKRYTEAIVQRRRLRMIAGATRAAKRCAMPFLLVSPFSWVWTGTEWTPNHAHAEWYPSQDSAEKIAEELILSGRAYHTHVRELIYIRKREEQPDGNIRLVDASYRHRGPNGTVVGAKRKDPPPPTVETDSDAAWKAVENLLDAGNVDEAIFAARSLLESGVAVGRYSVHVMARLRPHVLSKTTRGA